MKLRSAAVHLAAPVLYRRPVSGLQPVRLYRYLDELFRTSEVEGAVVEVGCHLGGTAAIAYRFLEQIGCERQYVCVDTFSGFVDTQYDADRAEGLREDDRSMFSSNSPKLVRRLLDQYGAKSVELVAGDICTLSESALPSEIAVALIDVDLGDPVRCALDILYPKLMPGGAILIDDCPEKSSWVGARPAVVKWAAERGVVAEFDYGFGRIAVDQS